MKLIEDILSGYKEYLQNDYEVYKNHLYRIYSFMILMDNNKNNHDKYAIACVFHDLGIWTQSFDYIEPSKQLAKLYLVATNQENLITEILLMIENHHKIFKYDGDFEKTVEVFRIADWCDVSMGLLRKKIAKKKYRNILNQFSNKGFHFFLIKQSFKYFLKHPFNPLPMFKF